MRNSSSWNPFQISRGRIRLAKEEPRALSSLPICDMHSHTQRGLRDHRHEKSADSLRLRLPAPPPPPPPPPPPRRSSREREKVRDDSRIPRTISRGHRLSKTRHGRASSAGWEPSLPRPPPCRQVTSPSSDVAGDGRPWTPTAEKCRRLLLRRQQESSTLDGPTGPGSIDGENEPGRAVTASRCLSAKGHRSAAKGLPHNRAEACALFLPGYSEGKVSNGALGPTLNQM
ncbi:hypothetical protein MPTK1_7g14120 [Marchantia polymorpha subsp. ruderalis]|uniref:Uncharacterized protein n=2 Tax=Marchantia polymorpha TaxID=3197 RepID=A0AAF6BZF4_MARPO|nr:hypothetical protein MARPO_0009s0097 [Marchantia polymorpha]BBN17388.1 hypothetical protein Mp_7g14120 [Marchantia polymorpha subsp. ruderalis]|eukprot:PTQ46993.1 hypothetical protein MARPO_0009s0097 [Marchantia polymorpha]